MTGKFIGHHRFARTKFFRHRLAQRIGVFHNVVVEGLFHLNRFFTVSNSIDSANAFNSRLAPSAHVTGEIAEEAVPDIPVLDGRQQAPPPEDTTVVIRGEPIISPR